MIKSDEELNRTDLDLLAFQYIADELDDRAAAQFEEQLAADQSAREAVAAAVELTQSLLRSAATHSRAQHSATVGAMPANHRQQNLRRRLGWAVVSVAALCVWFVASLLLVSDQAPEEVAQRDPSTVGPVSQVVGTSEVDASTAAQLVGLWADSEFSTNGHGAESAGEAAAADAFAAPLSSNALAAESGIVVPDWIMAAVSADLGREPSDSSDGPKEN